MRYSHYYEVNWDSSEWLSAWSTLVKEAPMIFEAADVLICGPGSTDRTINPPVADEHHGIIFNGFAQERCDDFCLSRGSDQNSIETDQKAYDLVVACLLLRAHLLAPNSFQIRSNGPWDELAWLDVRFLYLSLWYADLQCPWGEQDEYGSGETSSLMPGSLPHADPDQISSAEPTVIMDIDLLPTMSSSISADPVTPEVLSLSASISSSMSIDPPKSVHPDLSGSLNSLISTDTPINLAPDLPAGVSSSVSTDSESRFAPIKEWLRQCDGNSDHAECAALPFQWQSIPETSFRLIDIDQRCVVNAPEHCSYLALGYVLKGEDNVQLNRQTSAVLMRPGGLDILLPRISTVVQDGIIVCTALEERYLWAASLCIMQDAPRDRKFHSQRMSMIYAGAKVLLAPVSAGTASERLLQELPVGPSTVDSAESLEALLMSSPWMRREWSYQEIVFSHRALLFTSEGIFMQCQEGTYNATGTRITAPGNKRAQVRTVGGMLCNPSHGLDSYLSAVEDYSQRDFTERLDRRDAFKAIIRGYQGLIGNQPWIIWYGLPLFALDQTICWRTDQHHPHLRNPRFPSWSWLGWNDRVSFDRTLIGRACTCQMAEYPHWYRPGQFPRRPIHQNHPDKFGFPTNVGCTFLDRPYLLLYASLARMRIGHYFIESDSTNGLYPVFRLNVAPDGVSHPLTDAMSNLMISSNSAMEMGHGGSDEDATGSEVHEAWQHINPLGYIWLDRGWRNEHHRDWTMKFMALTGECDSEEDKATITMLMALEPLREDGEFVGWERVQVIDCRITEDTWKSFGGSNASLKLF